MEMRITSIVKLILIVAVGLFILKIASKWIAKKMPNKVTAAVDTVVQAA